MWYVKLDKESPLEELENFEEIKKKSKRRRKHFIRGRRKTKTIEAKNF